LLGDSAEALGCYRRAVSLRPDSGDFCRNLGVALSEQGGDLFETLACFNVADDGSPDAAEAPCSGRGKPPSANADSRAVRQAVKEVRSSGEAPEMIR
jgi:hypothetical protein